MEIGAASRPTEALFIPISALRASQIVTAAAALGATITPPDGVDPIDDPSTLLDAATMLNTLLSVRDQMRHAFRQVSPNKTQKIVDYTQEVKEAWLTFKTALGDALADTAFAISTPYDSGEVAEWFPDAPLEAAGPQVTLVSDL